MDSKTELSKSHIIDAEKTFSFPVGAQLQVEVEGVTVKLNSQAIGYVFNEFLIIRYPYAPGIGSLADKLYKGVRVTVRYLDKGNVLGFQSSLIQVSNEPARILFITFPPSVTRHALRENKRFSCSLPSQLFSTAAKDGGDIRDTAYNGITSDISLSGCALNLNTPAAGGRLPHISMGKPVKLVMQLPGIERKIAIYGTIRRTRTEGHGLRVGIEFQVMNEEVRRMLEDFIAAVDTVGLEK